MSRPARECNPCPICGKRPLLHSSSKRGVDKYYLICHKCNIRGRNGNSYSEAYEIWNRKEFVYPTFERNGRYGCIYCKNLVDASGKHLAEKEWYTKAFCFHDKCPYRDILEKYESYEEYFENEIFEFSMEFGFRTDSYHLVIGGENVGF